MGFWLNFLNETLVPLKMHLESIKFFEGAAPKKFNLLDIQDFKFYSLKHKRSL